ncbi:MAG: HEAT repeat domain-containing protein, partial [Thermodesulfobacteriota bacterium]
PDLDLFSRMTDRHQYLRRAVFLSLLAGLPLFLYTFLFSLLSWAFSFVLPRNGFVAAAGLTCLMLGLSLLVPVAWGRAAHGEDPGRLLASPSSWRRVAGLRAVSDRNLEITGFPGYRRLMASPNPAERYWLTKAFGYSRDPETYDYLIRMLDDPQPNVARLALASLGRRQDPRAVDLILGRLKVSRHWYFQWYGYRALRSLGWSQKPSE